ncbi:MAG: hypothetical protein QOK39_799 [Acidimicrobiaceae bacterium]|jgi:hypothetical protein|nr:hypothetical protein [Acidimicrobiaceae bacterium]
MNSAVVVLGAILCLIGGAWIGQGVGLIGGSFMTGQGIWAVIGAATFVAGMASIRRGFLRRPS